MMGYYYNYNPDYLFGFGWVFMIVFWVLLIWFIIALIKNSTERHHHVHRHDGMMDKMDKTDNDKALAILKERYAKSEINKEEYEDKKRTLMM